jgi:hypothetical protein
MKTDQMEDSFPRCRMVYVGSFHIECMGGTHTSPLGGLALVSPPLQQAAPQYLPAAASGS